MNWYVAKMVYRIICGEGNHSAQFDEQLRLITAADEEEAFDKAVMMGKKEEDAFLNQKNELVRWKFIHVCELYRLSQLIDGAEIYSRISEVEDASGYIHYVEQKARSIQDKSSRHMLNLV